LRSKLGDDPLLGRRQPPQRASDAVRKRQARALRGFVESLLAADPHARVLVAGDLNDLEFAEPGEGSDHPVAILEGALGGPRLLDLVRIVARPSRFSFVFEGNAQSLDHMIASPALLHRLAGIDVLHFCASFPEALERDERTPLRASDHDALEARFSWPPAAVSPGAGARSHAHSHSHSDADAAQSGAPASALAPAPRTRRQP
jgi:uncharacterized protein